MKRLGLPLDPIVLYGRDIQLETGCNVEKSLSIRFCQ